MTRDELEASFRRNLTELHVPARFHNALVDNFLPDADAYAIYTQGITADRRDAITPEPAVIHYSYPIACGTTAHEPRWTGDYTRVTCGRCKRTGPWRNAVENAAKEASRA